MRRVRSLLASFIVDPACHVDFRQQVPREDRHAIAKGRLGALIRDHSNGVAYDQAENPALTPSELVRLMDAFTNSNDGTSMLEAFRFARVHAKVDMLPAHYNSLMRHYSYARDRPRLLQVLNVAAHHGEVNHETISVVVSGLHHFSTRRRLPLMLEVIDVMTKSNIQLATRYESREAARGMPELVDGTFGRPRGLVAPSTGDDAADATAPFHSQVLSSLLHAVANGPEGPIAALLVACWVRAAGAEVCLWDYVNLMTALQRDTEMFPDVAQVFGQLGATSKSSARLPAGSSSASAPAQSSKDDDAWGSASSSPAAAAATAADPQPVESGYMTVPLVVAAAQRWANAKIGSRSSHASERKAGSRKVADPLDRASAVLSIAEALEAWWQTTAGRSGVDVHTPVFVGFVNTRPRGLEQLLKSIVDEAARRKTILPARNSALSLHHTSAIVYHSSANKIAAVNELREAWSRRQAWERKYLPKESPEAAARDDEEGALAQVVDSDYVTSLRVHRSGGAINTASSDLADRLKRPDETFALVEDAGELAVDNWMIKEVANFFAEVPAKVRHGVSDSYSKLSERANQTQDLSENDQRILWALSQPLMSTATEAEQAIDYIRANSGSFRAQHKAVKHMVRCLILTATLHSPLNPKLTANGIRERHKWGMYMEARDIALTLFGATRNGRENMKALYNRGGKLAALRSEDAIAGDTAAVNSLFRRAAEQQAAQERELSTSGGGGEACTALATGFATVRPTESIEYARTKERFDRGAPPSEWMSIGRSSSPVVATTSTRRGIVPAHMADPAVPNPYPHIGLRGGRPVPDMPDMFPDVKRLLTRLGDPWWLGEPETYIALLRCYLYRLDWEGAVAITEAAFKGLTLTAQLDGQIQRVFEEIGDPMGAIPFKVAAKVVDMRIAGKGGAQKGAGRQQPASA